MGPWVKIFTKGRWIDIYYTKNNIPTARRSATVISNPRKLVLPESSGSLGGQVVYSFGKAGALHYSTSVHGSELLLVSLSLAIQADTFCEVRDFLYVCMLAGGNKDSRASLTWLVSANPPTPDENHSLACR